MPKEEFLRKLAELLELPPGSLTGPEALAGLENWDSLAVMSFMAMVDEQCGVAVAPKQLAACKTVDDLLQLTNTLPA